MKSRTVSGFGGASLAAIVVTGALIAGLALAAQGGGLSLRGAPI